MANDGDKCSETGGSVYHHTFSLDETEGNLNLIRTIAKLKGVDETDLAPLYPCIDHLVEHLFASPPSQDAQAELDFTYEGYRITLFQDGNAVFRKMH